MKKLIYILLIIISLLLFGCLIFITINANILSNSVKTIWFMLIGYLSVIIFTVFWLKLVKK